MLTMTTASFVSLSSFLLEDNDFLVLLFSKILAVTDAPSMVGEPKVDLPSLTSMSTCSIFT